MGMTHEEAIKMLEYLATDTTGELAGMSGDYAEFLVRVVDALDMAIAALREREERSNGCAYCHHQGTIHGEDFTEIEVVKIIPLPAIDLGTGRMESKADPPYWALRITGDGEDFAEIRFCPMCGRRLEDT